jgi:hypothetical protein
MGAVHRPEIPHLSPAERRAEALRIAAKGGPKVQAGVARIDFSGKISSAVAAAKLAKDDCNGAA